jgi:hypothetical protein
LEVRAGQVFKALFMADCLRESALLIRNTLYHDMVVAYRRILRVNQNLGKLYPTKKSIESIEPDPNTAYLSKLSLLIN